MAERFHQAYAELTGFVADHPEIEIRDSVISIPEEVRLNFYGLFNRAREVLVEEDFPAKLANARTLQEKYNKAAETAAEWLSLEDPPTVSGLRRFLRDPRDCLTRELFDPLFDLLKGRESIDSFKERASAGIEEIFPVLFRGGYEKWAVLSFLNLVGIEKALRVNSRSMSPGERTKPAAQAPIEEVPFPEESKNFFFSQPRNSVFAVPDFIVRSPRLRRFVGIRSEFRECSYNALNASSERRWHPVDADLLRLLGNGLTLVYVSERAECIALMADVARFCAPDLIFFCVDTLSLSRSEALEIMKQADTRLKPPRGCYVIANHEWLEPSGAADIGMKHHLPEESANVLILTVGYDEAKLTPVLEALVDSNRPTATT